ncbi:hypothetical protein [Gilvimarinus chinensis]|uniref:hypothetical protein n=1 Tax=Gilvimarinus chinensis TaxID=396005 RepID=UPI000375F223|nr:hypothetical protein [Gilvimarinus chinensis]
MNVTLPNGVVIQGVPDGATKSQIMRKAIAAGLATEADFGGAPSSTQQQAPEQERGFVDRVKGFAGDAYDAYKGSREAALTMASGMIAEPVAGLAGIGAAVMPGGKTGGEMVESVRDAMTYQPRSEAGQEYVGKMADELAPVTDAIAGVEQASGDFGYDQAGPIGGAVGTAAPTAAMELAGLGAVRRGARAADSVRNIAKATPAAEAQQVLDAGKRWDVPVMNTDVNPPKTFSGKVMQSFSEKMGPLGSGTARASQQAARQEAVESLAKEFNAELNSPFADEMVKSLKSKHAQDMAEAAAIRKSAVEKLDQYGQVPLTKTVAAIDRQLARQERLGARADGALVEKLTRTKSALENGNFSLVKDIRTEVIDDIKALARSEDQRALSSVQSVKSAIDDDLMDFAKANDRRAAAEWTQSNRKFAETLSSARDSELKRVLNSGDVTPEKVLPILRGGKASELKRLKSGLTEDGIKSAKAALVRDMLDESGFFRGDVNPDRLATSMGKSNRMKAINTFFEGRERREIEGLRRLLDSTRQAQRASVAPPTGVQTVPLISGGLGAAGATAFGAIPTMATAGTLSAVAKAYESVPFRNLMLKIGNSQKGSIQEKRLLDAATTAFVAELQAAKEQQQQTEQRQQQP